MAKNLRKYISIGLISVMLFSLASCKGAGDVVDVDTDVSDNSTVVDEPEEPVDENDPLYANADLATKNVYDVTFIDSPHGNEGYYIKGGKTDDGVYYVYSLSDEYNNYAFFVELYDNSGNLSDTYTLSKPVGNDYYENEKTAVVEANEEIKGIDYEFPMDLLEEYKLDCEAVDDISYGSFHMDSDGNIESILTIWTYDTRGDNSTEYFDVLWDDKGECTDIVHIPLDLKNGYVNNIAYLDDDSLLMIYANYENDVYSNKAVIYGADRFYDIKSSVKAENKDLGEWTTYLGSVISVDDKTLALYWDYDGDGKVYVSEIDPETIEADSKTEVKLLGGGSTYACGASDDGSLVFSLNSGLQVWKEDEKGKLFLDYVNSDLPANGCSNLVSVDGLDEFYASFYRTDDTQMLAFCKAVDPASVKKSKVITLAENRLYSDLMDRIIEFNTSDNGCRIVVRDYEVYETYENYKAGVEKLYEDMMNGRMCDIVSIDYMSDLDVRSLVDKDLIADIGELIENDPSMSMDDYCTNVFDAVSIKGHLYQVIPNYVVNTVYGSVDHLDGNENWNVDTFLDYAEEAENNGDMMFNIYMSRSEFVNDIIYNLGNYWVDLDRNICDFNDPSFYKLIGYSLTLPETIDFGSEKAQYYWDNYDNLMKEGGLRLKNITFTDFRSDYFSAYADCNAVPVCIGWPSPDSNGSSIGYSNYFMLNKDSLLIDQSWDFVKYFITDYQSSDRFYNFPVLKSALHDKIAHASKPYTATGTDGKDYDYTFTYYYDGEELEVPLMTDDQIADFEEFFLSVDRLYFTDSEIMEIMVGIIDEAAYEGKTPEETASSLQIAVQECLDGR